MIMKFQTAWILVCVSNVIKVKQVHKVLHKIISIAIE